MRFLWWWWLLPSSFLCLSCLSSLLCLACKYSSVCDASLQLESESDDVWWNASSESSVESGSDAELGERSE